LQEKPLAKIQYPFLIKVLKKLGIAGTYLNTVKATYNKPIANIILIGGKLKSFFLKSGTKSVLSHYSYSL
jgi:hypothetical protein